MSRPNKIQSQLEAALRDAEKATEADISVQKLIQTRLTILNDIASRQHSAKIRKLKKRLAQYQTENERLEAELAKALAGADAVKGADAVTTEINEALAKYHGGKNEYHV
jgi:uncharacterized small protein (DUF1192 family)